MALCRASLARHKENRRRRGTGRGPDLGGRRRRRRRRWCESVTAAAATAVHSASTTLAHHVSGVGVAVPPFIDKCLIERPSPAVVLVRLYEDARAGFQRFFKSTICSLMRLRPPAYRIGTTRRGLYGGGGLGLSPFKIVNPFLKKFVKCSRPGQKCSSLLQLFGVSFLQLFTF